jgi:hypothetical protein
MSPKTDDTNGWVPWSQHVLAELKRLNSCYEALRLDVEKIKVETGQLKIRAGLTGLVGGLIPVLIMFGIRMWSS